jgi:hypothetical protein
MGRSLEKAPLPAESAVAPYHLPMRATPLTAILALALSLAVPTYAGAEVIVPPGNSAAAQYTEAFPTASGERDTDKQKQKRSPQKVLGEEGSKQLQSKGQDGKAVAEIVAETSPAPDSAAAAVEPESSGGQAGGSGNSRGPKDGGEGDSQQSSGGGPPAGGGNGGFNPNGGAAAKTTVEASGSSGLGEAVGQATGASSSDGLGMGLLLPLILVGGLVWAILFAWRRRQQDQRVA